LLLPPCWVFSVGLSSSYLQLCHSADSQLVQHSDAHQPQLGLFARSQCLPPLADSLLRGRISS
jgi:hypothetical protein